MIPRVVDYLNYRDFLQDFYLAKKSLKSEYSYRAFNLRAGIKSPSHLKSVIDRKRNLTHKSVDKYIRGLDFKKKAEERYFKYLVEYNQESNLVRKEELFKLLMLEKKKKSLSMIEQAQFNFLSNWYNVAIYVLLDMADFKKNDERLLKFLKFKVTKKDLEESFSVLILLGLIKENSHGFYKQSTGALSTVDEIKDIAIHKYHNKMIDLAINSLNNDALEEREFNGATIPIDIKKLPEVKEKIRKFRREINQYASSMDNPTHVYQLNIQLFSLSQELES